MNRFISMFFVYLLLLVVILFTVMSGVGYYYFSSAILSYSININLKVLFGIGIGVGLMLFMLVWLFFAFPKFFLHYVLTFPGLIVMCSVYIAATQPSEVTRHLTYYSILWSNNLQTREFQTKYKCCGFYNFTDRGIYNCPITYESGCSHFIEMYLRPRFMEIFVSGIFIIISSVISVCALLIIFFRSDESSIFELMQY
ncbi:hypothetical protein TRFO_04073 [Tritrichomonas foetus]|uniref:Tetraspanin family protein n=1 Tax=Tritrichomonas foetus TaxID=1144522 RepID=A0A1J4KIB6_9EUKA|nr:hypothetical protein TRFO_04073 [Tritrichomonas foetus]|eukprot:OHT11113.1 hypothetical protein TRFO_04073 [Tritrichomonas foetus]